MALSLADELASAFDTDPDVVDVPSLADDLAFDLDVRYAMKPGIFSPVLYRNSFS